MIAALSSVSFASAPISVNPWRQRLHSQAVSHYECNAPITLDMMLGLLNLSCFT